MKVKYDTKKAIQDEIKFTLYCEKIRKFKFIKKIRLIINIFKKGD